MEEIVDKLKRLGLTEYQARTLAALLQRGEMSATALAAAASVPITKLYTVLDALADMGLIIVSLGRPKSYRAVQSAAIADQLIKRQENLLAALKGEKVALVRALGTGRRPTRAARVEFYPTTDMAWVSLIDIFKRTKRTFCLCASPSEWRNALTRQKVMKVGLALSLRGVTARNIISRDMAGLLVKEAIKHKINIIRILLSGRIEYRTVDAKFLNQSFLIRDDEEIALGFKDENGDTCAGLHITDSSIARGMMQYFETFWAIGEPINMLDIAKAMIKTR